MYSFIHLFIYSVLRNAHEEDQKSQPYVGKIILGVERAARPLKVRTGQVSNMSYLSFIKHGWEIP